MMRSVSIAHLRSRLGSRPNVFLISRSVKLSALYDGRATACRSSWWIESPI
jgi:hypothetical protein